MLGVMLFGAVDLKVLRTVVVLDPVDVVDVSALGSAYDDAMLSRPDL